MKGGSSNDGSRDCSPTLFLPGSRGQSRLRSACTVRNDAVEAMPPSATTLTITIFVATNGACSELFPGLSRVKICSRRRLPRRCDCNCRGWGGRITLWLVVSGVLRQ